MKMEDNGGGHSLGGSSSESSTPLTAQEVRDRRLAALERFNKKPAPVNQSAFPTTPRPPTPPKRSSKISTSSPVPIVDDEEDSKPAAIPSPASSKVNVAPDTNVTPDKRKSAISFDDQPMTISAGEADYDDDDAALQAALAMSLAESQPATAVASMPISAPPPITFEMDENEQLAAALRLSMEAVSRDDSTESTEKMESVSPVPMDISPTKRPPFQPVLTDEAQWSEDVKAAMETTMQPCNILDFHCIMWDPSVTTPNDQQRWLKQGIKFKVDDSPLPEAKDSLLAAMLTNNSWGLTQVHGGPCGVLASLQAEFLRLLLFGPRKVDANAAQLYSIDFPATLSNRLIQNKPDLSPTLLRQGLALAMGMVLARASLKASATLADDDKEQGESSSQLSPERYSKEPKVTIAVPKPDIDHDLDWEDLEPWSAYKGIGLSEMIVTYTISLPMESANKRPKLSSSAKEEMAKMEEEEKQTMMKLARRTARFLLETNLIEWFQREGGVLMFVASLSFSRGIPNIQGDMDDTTAKLTSSFGHCSQELINLLLTGQAVSNVFDHTLRPSGELICRGIQQKPDIGYLSALEAMRYLEVGGYYKTPKYPIWVVGSTSHFTVMFGDAACLKESSSDILLEKVRRAFKRMEGGAEENGFIQSQQLGQFLKSLELDIADHNVQTLAAAMEVHGAGIILWEDLWKRTSRLLTGASLEAVLAGDTENGATQTVTAAPAAPEQLSDEELARRLQAEWNGEPVVLPPAPAPPPQAPPAAQRKEEYGKTFQMYHYNGLRGGNLRCFRVTPLSADEAIGASVSLGSGQSSVPMMVDSGSLEDVLRCKWPSCKIDWMGNPQPSID